MDKKFLLYLSFLFLHFTAYGQADRVRTSTIDYSVYDQLIQNLHYAPDKFKALKLLLTEIETKFTPEDEEYFYGYRTAGMHYQQLYYFKESIDCFQKAIGAYEKHFPFDNRGYSLVSKEFALGVYLDLARSFRSLNLSEKSIRYLQFQRNIFDSASISLKLQYHSELSQALLSGELYDQAIEEALKLKTIVESGRPLIDIQPADSIYKINDNFPQETREALRKAKEEYIRTMKSAEESVRSSQQLMYNSILSQAYFKQYQFKESIPYSQAWLKEYVNIMKYAKEATNNAMKQASLLPDSTMKLLKDSYAYMNIFEEIGGQATSLIISACKENQKTLALSYARGYLDKAVYYQLEGNTEEAEKNYQNAFSQLNKLSESRFYKDMGHVMYDAFAPMYINLQIQKQNLSRAYEENFKLIVKEEDNLKKNFQFFSESEKKEFFKAYNQRLEKFYSLLLFMTEHNADRTGEMLNKILQTKGLVFDVTREQERRLKQISDKATLADIQTVRNLRDRLSAFYQASTKSPDRALMDSINRYSIRINALERTINEKLGAFTNFLKPLDWRDVQKKLKPDEVHLEIVRIQRDLFNFEKPVVQYWAFAIRTGDEKPQLIMLSEGETFEGRSLRNYQNRIRTLLDDRESYNTYWAGIEKAISGKQKIFLSSDGVYHMINPLTLRNPTTGNFILQEVMLTRVSTGRDLLTNDTETMPNKSVALVGNPDFKMSRKALGTSDINQYISGYDRIEESTRSGFAELPGTQEELELIGNLASQQGFNTKALTGADASEVQVKDLKNPGILHFATHGEFDQHSKVESFLKSKLVLAGAADDDPIPYAEYGKYEDGFLTAYEVVQLTLEHTHLVVLSACETGLGEIQSGEGVWGLQRAFQVAGTKTVMGSLWKISDAATVEFMEKFYAAYFNGKSITAAYFAAMIFMAEKYPHPYYWGPFVVTGRR